MAEKTEEIKEVKDTKESKDVKEPKKSKFDPSKITFGSVLTKDKDEKGFVKLKDGKTDQWVSGVVRIEVIDLKTSNVLEVKELPMTKAKYEAFREDFDTMSNEDRLANYFDE